MINPISEINIIVTTITANSGNILFNYFLQVMHNFGVEAAPLGVGLERLVRCMTAYI